MFSALNNLLIGKSLRTDQLKDEKFNAFWGLPILSSDPISSVAYAGEAILLVLLPIIGMKSYTYMFLAALCIVFLLFILVFSYSQTIDSYPNGGGAYIVAKENLGVVPGLLAGAALSTDYILTVAVSASAGMAAVVSYAPSLANYKVILTILVIILITIGNLRGIRESSKLFGVPTYLFIFSIGAMIVTGIFKVHVLGIQPKPYYPDFKYAAGNISILLFLKAFASGCTALTGVEAVSNGIPNFKEPSQRNAKLVLIILACIVLLIFGGMSYLTTLYHAIPGGNVTVIAQVASEVFGKGFMFFLIQITTAIILAMAANTAFSGLPLLLALIARDGYAPRQFTRRGKRLSFSNGIILLALAACILVILFHADEQRLLPLYALGVFISFTLSQYGMFHKWIKSKSKGWRHKALINGLGAVITGFVCVLIAITKFQHGAWIACVFIVFLVVCMLRIRNHYTKVATQLKLCKDERPKDITPVDGSQHVIILVDTLNKAFLKSLNYSKHLSNNIIAFHVSTDHECTLKLKAKWEEYNVGIPLVIKESPYRDLIGPLVSFIESEEHASKPGEIVTVVMSQFVITKWWHNILHNQTSLFIKNMLYKHRNIVVTTVPYIINE